MRLDQVKEWRGDLAPRHGSEYVIQVSVLVIDLAIRFWNLDLDFLWLDELQTARSSLGRSFQEVPVESLVLTSRLEKAFVFSPDGTPSENARIAISEEAHPPVFFCLMPSWMHLAGFSMSTVRAPRALRVVAVLVAVCELDRAAFSRIPSAAG